MKYEVNIDIIVAKVLKLVWIDSFIITHWKSYVTYEIYVQKIWLVWAVIDICFTVDQLNKNKCVHCEKTRSCINSQEVYNAIIQYVFCNNWILLHYALVPQMQLISSTKFYTYNEI